MSLLVDVVTRVESYINGEEISIENKACYVKECVPITRGSQHLKKNNYTSPVKDNTTFKHGGKNMERFTLMNTHSD